MNICKFCGRKFERLFSKSKELYCSDKCKKCDEDGWIFGGYIKHKLSEPKPKLKDLFIQEQKLDEEEQKYLEDKLLKNRMELKENYNDFYKED